jgi:hypothetical protein
MEITLHNGCPFVVQMLHGYSICARVRVFFSFGLHMKTIILIKNKQTVYYSLTFILC